MTNTPTEEQLNDEMLDPKKGLFNWCLRLFKGMIHSDKKIGEMNGKWAALFRIVLVLVFLGLPALGTWTVWITKNIWNAQNHIETTAEFEGRIDLLERNAMILDRVDKSVNEIRMDLKNRPNPVEVKEQVEQNRDAVKSVKDSLTKLDKDNTDQHNEIANELGEQVNELERKNATDHATMKTTLEFIKEQVSKK